MSAALAEDLLRPEAYPAPPPLRVELRETHISLVFLTEGDVYKVKKPVHFSFLDNRSLAARRTACEAEMQLNSRLAASTYLGVVAVRLDARGRHHFGPEGTVVDWAVHMLRLPDERRLDRRLAEGLLSAPDVEALAAHVADFHARVRCDEETSRWGTDSAIAKNIVETFSEVDAAAEGLLGAEQVHEIRVAQLGFLNEGTALFDERRRSGKVREGHGDLRLDQIYVNDDGTFTILDCLEFDERFRCADVGADIAFLSMDLMAHGRVDLAERLLASYARAAGDYDLYAVVDFYESYRAWIRGKIAVLTSRTATWPRYEESIVEARRYFALALAANRRSLLEPVVVAVGGIIASGKSTVAKAVGELLAAPVVDADRTRKELVGLATMTHDTSGAFEGLYAPAMTERVYAELQRRASVVLASGRPVVLDASFRTAAMRGAVQELAREHGVPFSMIECRARPETCRARLVERAREATGVSDGRLAIFDAFCAEVEPHLESVLVIDTEKPLAQTLRILTDLLQTPAAPVVRRDEEDERAPEQDR